MTRLLTVLFLITGATGLIYEVVLGRFLALELGSSGESHAITLAAFLGGLSLGAFLVERTFRQRLRAAKRPLLAYAALEACIGAWMLVFPTMITLVFDGFATLAVGLDPTSWVVTAIKLGAAAVLVLPLSLMLGATLPVIAVAVTRTVPNGSVVIISRLYAVNAAGAAFGAYLAGFWLIERFGLELPLLGGAVLNIGVGAIVYVAARAGRASEPSADPAPEQTSTPTSPTSTRPHDPSFGMPLSATVIAAGLTGLVTLLYEIVWTRLSGLLLGASVYAFAMMLVVVILGISIGSGLSTRAIGLGRSPRAVFAFCQAAAALCAALLLMRLESLPGAVFELRAMFAPRPEAFDLWVKVGGGFVMLHFLPSAIALGASFPALLAAAHAGGAETDKATAWILGSNTFGNLLGALVGSFVLMPRLGVDGVLAAGGVASIVVTGFAVRPRHRSVIAPAILSATAILVIAVGWPTLDTLYQGLFREPIDERPPKEQLAGKTFGERVFRQDGTDCSITVHQFPSGRRTFKMNGKTDGSVGGGARGDQMTQILVGHLGFLYRPKVEQAFLVGLGTGQTAGAMVTHGAFELTIAELNQGVIDAAPFFATSNGDVLNHPGVTVWLTDAREALRSAAKGSIDMYVSEPSNPWVVGVADLYTREYLERVKTRLSPNGVVVQWVQAYEQSDEILRSILCTVRGVFPNVALFRLGVGDLAMVASQDPLVPDLEAAKSWFQDPAIRASLDGGGARNFAQSVDELVLFSLAGPTRVSEVCANFGVPLESRYPHLEYAAPRFVFGQHTAGDLLRTIDGRVRPPYDSLAATWFSAHPPSEVGRTAIRDFLDSEPYDYERALRAAVSGPEALPSALRALIATLPSPENLPDEAVVKGCNQILRTAPWLRGRNQTVLGPPVPALARWFDRCREHPASRAFDEN